MAVVTNVMAPIAKGSVKITTNNPFAAPRIDPNLLGTTFDLHVMITAIKSTLKYFSTKAFKGYYIGPSGDLAKATTDAQLEAYARANSAT